MDLKGYKWEAGSEAGFVQQLAVAYIGHGYRYYVVRVIPEGKDLAKVDAKMLECYGAALSKWQRARRKQAGKANVQYLRYGRFAVLIATGPIGGHVFYAECKDFKDIRKRAIRFAGYSIGCSYSTRTEAWHASVRIWRKEYEALRERMLYLAARSSVEELEVEFSGMRFEPYAWVARQYLSIRRAVNDERKRVNREEVTVRSLKLRRHTLLPFEVLECLDGGNGGRSAKGAGLARFSAG